MLDATRKAIINRVKSIKKGFDDCIELMDLMVQRGQL